MADQVNIICKRTVVSTKPVERGKWYPLSVLDRLMEHNHIRMVYYYRCAKAMEMGKMTKKMRESMAETLSNFPVMTGRLVRDEEGKWVVKCNDAGVRVVEGRAKGSVDEWLRCVDRESEAKLVYWEEMDHKPYFWSTFYVQLTEFEGGGIAIGLSCTHLLADPTCAAVFVKAWADTTFGRTISCPPLCHPLPPRIAGPKMPNHAHSITHYYKSCIERSSPSIKSTNNGTTTVAFLFTDPMVRACSASARPRCGALLGTGGSVVSHFQALAGLFWVCVSKAKRVKDGLVDMSMCLDMRQILSLDQGYFGNCMVYNKVPGEMPLKDGKAGNKLTEAVRLIEDATEKMDYEGIMDLIEWLKCNDSDDNKLTNGSDLVCINLENSVGLRMTTFDEDFTPARASCHVEGASYGLGRVIVLPSEPGEGPMGRVVMVTLPEEEMVKILEDELLQSFSPIVLMGRNKQINKT